MVVDHTRKDYALKIIELASLEFTDHTDESFLLGLTSVRIHTYEHLYVNSNIVLGDFNTIYSDISVERVELEIATFISTVRVVFVGMFSKTNTLLSFNIDLAYHMSSIFIL